MHFGEVATNINNFLTPFTPSIGYSRLHSLQYTIPHCNTTSHQKSFFIATAKDWNAPPPSAVPYSMVPQWLARFLAIGKPPKPVDDWNDLSANGFATLPGPSTMKLAIILEV